MSKTVRKKVIVVGGGAAGMMAAIFAARKGNDVTLLEKNEKLGKKLYITGKGRCNLTNACEMERLFSSVISNSKFLYSSFYSFSNDATIQFFEGIGLPIKVERGNRAFPRSDKSSDVIQALHGELRKHNVKIHYHHKAKGIITRDGRVKGISVYGKEPLEADAVIIATGGLSYPSTGSTGDGYRFAKEIGHNVTETTPSLVPLVTKEEYVSQLQGLSLKNASISIRYEDKEVYQDFGELLFTHFGVSGPVILSASCYVKEYLGDSRLTIHIDLKPSLSKEQLNNRILRDFNQYKNQQFKNVLNKLLPKKMIPVIISLSGISAEKQVSNVTKEERMRLLAKIKDFPLTIVDTRGYLEAVVTKGGINVKEIDPQTMESKKCKGVYFIGEVLDLDAKTGGFNLQIAWSTAYMAGNAV